MDFLMDMLRAIAEIRNPVLDFFFETITHLGEETLFLVISIVFFWCINKREGYFILLTGLFGTLINQAAKLAFRIPRPWVIDESFQPVGNSKIEATGYSFPSGHTQNISTTLGAITAYKPNKWKTAILTTIIILVAFSRMYLGVHTLLDVSVSLVIGLVLVLCFRPFFASEERFDKALPYIVIAAMVASAGFFTYVLLVRGDSSLDAGNYGSALKNACTLIGCTVGLAVVWFFDTEYINFKTDGKWYAQVIKAILGFAIVLAIKEGLRTPLELLFAGNTYIARIIRYFLIVFFAGAIWPLTFKWFSGLKIGFLDKFTNFLSEKFKNKESKNSL